MTTKTIDEDRVKDYFDRAINHWLGIYNRGLSPEEMAMARNYIDAFQSARESLIGERLPIVKPK